MSQAEATMSKGRADIRDTATAGKYYDQGWAAEQAGDRSGAIEAYRAGYMADPDHVDLCFRLAYNLDLAGEEDEAIVLYEQCVTRDAPHLNALLNLAVLYEDRNQFAKAERYLRQILATAPNHPRARLFLKDVIASKEMVVDDEQDKKLEKHNAMLDTPVTDFELSIRTRNALRKMKIRTLGDLLKMSEAEMRGFKNFGDSSLDEIKAMLAQRGLRLGQAVEQHHEAVKQQIYDELRGKGGNEDVLARPVGDLDMSVRARKALALLNVSSIGDLVMKTEAELMGVKNFGQTSLVEIKAKLAEMGLSLRQLDQ